jgi:hypothetical protein
MTAPPRRFGNDCVTAPRGTRSFEPRSRRPLKLSPERRTFPTQVWARVSTYVFPVEAEEVAAEFNEAVDAFVGQQQPGLRRLEVFINPLNAAAMTVSLWESEEEMKASDDEADSLRRFVTLEKSGWIQRVDEYELVRSEPA